MLISYRIKELNAELDELNLELKALRNNAGLVNIHSAILKNHSEQEALMYMRVQGYRTTNLYLNGVLAKPVALISNQITFITGNSEQFVSCALLTTLVKEQQ